MQRGSSRRPLGCAPVGMGAGLPLGCRYLCSRRTQWTRGGTDLGAATWLSLERKRVRVGSRWGPPGSAAVCPPERLHMGSKNLQCSR
eukprot:jgi/Astpho2/5001/gw1.00071.67.1_t